MFRHHGPRQRRLRSRTGERQLHRKTINLPDPLQEIIYSFYKAGIKTRNQARSVIKRWAFYYSYLLRRRRLRRSGANPYPHSVAWDGEQYAWEVELESDNEDF